MLRTPLDMQTRQHKHLRRFAERTSVSRMRHFYAAAATDVEHRLRRAVRGTQPFEAHHYRVLLRELRGALRELAGGMAGVLSDTAREAMADAARRTVCSTKAVAKMLTGIEPRFAVEQAAVMRGMVDGMASSLLRRYRDLGESSWAGATIRRMEGVMALGLAEGVSSDEIGTRLMDDGFLKERYRADRIARTEAMYATNSVQVLTGRAMAKDMPGLKKRITAVLDTRTHSGCLALHGTVIGWGEAFMDPDGHSGVFPPLHPNCRCAVTAWHEDWEGGAGAESVAEGG